MSSEISWRRILLPPVAQCPAGALPEFAVPINTAYTNWAAPEVPTFRPRFGEAYTLTEDAANGLIAVTDGRGYRYTFWDFNAANATAGLAGRLKQAAAPGGATTAVVGSDGSGRPTETQTTQGTGSTAVTESIVRDYAANTATLRRQVGGGAWSTVRSVAYTLGSGGSSGQVVLAVVRDAAGAALETSYNRYYGSMYAAGGLKYAFGPAAYARLVADLGTGVGALTDAQVAPYADTYLEYDALYRVTKRVAAGAGCSACSGGQGTYTYAYAQRAEPFARLPNSWALKTVETQPDGNQATYYASGSNAILLKVYKDATTGQEWAWAYRYDGSRRVVLAAQPSAVSGYSEALDDLVGYAGGGATYLRAAAGLVTAYAYGTGGAPAGFLGGVSLSQGTGGPPVPQETRTYATAGDGQTFVPASDTRYRNADGTGAETTSYAYTWQGSTAQPATVTTTLPTVTTAENGPNAAAAAVTAYDAAGRPAWSKDAAGFLGYTAYDAATGAAVTSIADVNTALTADFTGLPAGWTMPAGGGLHLKTTYEVDGLGRATAATDPLGHATYTVYNDANHEVRTYAGWDATANAPTGPTAVSRDDRPGGYAESLTMSAAPHLTAGRPDGTEAVGGVQSLSRAYRNAAGQTVSSDAYFNLTGLTYTTATTLGVEGTNFDRTTQDFDKQGRPNRTRSAAGTIARTYSDGQGRAVSQWVGTNDTPAVGYWSPANPAGMTKVREFEYDGGGVGDGDRSKVTDFPGGGAAPRVTQTWFDWRDRAVAVKAGVEATESAAVNRPISYADYDNLGEVVQTRVYDGDAVTVTTTAGVPVAPAAGLLRAQSATAYDELGRAYQTRTFGVDPATGAVSTAALTGSVWFDLRGLTLKTLAPGGLVRKTAYDSLGRAAASYATDGGGDPAPGAAGTWAAAGNVTGDAVLSQSETTYDANGNATLNTRRDRFHDEAATGALGTPTAAPKARVSYSATYYDLADRATDAVEVGTNGGVAYVRPGTVPARSDTALVSSVSYDAAGWAFEATDPRGLKSRTSYDARGRTVKTVENYVDGVPSNLDDKTTEYAYGPAGMTGLTARLAGGGGQTTQWVYGVTVATGSGVNSNDIVGATRWPDPATGAASAAQQETATVNAVGQPLTATDRNGTTHAASYDVLGRVTDDAVTLLGVSVDGAVRRVHTDYDGQGNAYLLANYSAATGGTVVSQVQRAYNGLGQLTAEYQAQRGQDGGHEVRQRGVAGEWPSSAARVFAALICKATNPCPLQPSACTWSRARVTTCGCDTVRASSVVMNPATSFGVSNVTGLRVV